MYLGFCFFDPPLDTLMIGDEFVMVTVDGVARMRVTDGRYDDRGVLYPYSADFC